MDGRNTDGTFATGNQIATGENGHKKGYQRYADRAIYLMEKYSAGELADLANNDDELRKLPVRDAQIIKHLVNTLAGDDVRLERESLLDRIEGKPKEPKELSGGLDITIRKFYDKPASE